MNQIKVAGAALNQIPFDWQGNTNRILESINQAKAKKVAILCLPELCVTGYGCEDMFLSDWLSVKVEALISEILPHTQGITVSIGVPVRHKGQLYNCACFISDTKILGLSAKQFLANDGVHYEPRWFTAWPAHEIGEITYANQETSIGDIIYNHHGLKIAFEICEDMWHIDRPACRHYEKGVNLILNPSASHFAFNKSAKRVNLMLDASRKFNCYYLYANLLGNEAGRMVYDGEVVVAYKGHILKQNEKLSFEDINIVTAETGTVKSLEQYPNTPPDEDKNEMFARAASLALFDYLRKSRSGGFVLSLSGGADSSTCAVLVAEMIKRAVEQNGIHTFLSKIHKASLAEAIDGKTDAEIIKIIGSDILTCAYQGTRNSSNETLESAKKLAEEIGAAFHAWEIDDEVGSYSSKIEKAMGLTLNWEEHDIALQNIQARTRAPIIWMLANLKNALLLVTSNRSEGDVGYATMDGDTSGSIAPIAAVDKHFIINWLKWAEHELGYKSLSFVNNLQPTAELRPQDQTQTDEKDLMPYDILVQIERYAIKERKSPLEVYNIVKEIRPDSAEQLKGYIKKFYQLWCRNQWKRERTAPAFHLDDFNVDPRTWCRFPILSSSFDEELKALEKL